MLRRWLVAFVVILPEVVGVVAARAEDGVRFTEGVAPVLVRKCQGCHGPEKAKGGYRVDTFERLTKAGDGGTAPVTPGDPENSELFRRITTKDQKKRMPQKDEALPAEQIVAIEGWIRAGAKFDGKDKSAPLAVLVASGKEHPAAPKVYPRPVPVLALAFSPDGKQLAAGGYHEITVWDPADGRLLRRLGNVARQTHALAWSPDGKVVAAASGTPGSVGEVRLISPGNSEESRLLDRTGDAMLAVAFSPDGRRLAAAGADGALRVYDTASGRRLLLVEQHADWVTAVAFSPDGKSIATASRDKSARVFDAATGEMHSAYLGHAGPLFAVAWDAEGKRLFTAGRDREVHVWEPAAEGKKIATIGGFGGDLLRLAVSGDSLFSCCADGKLRRHATGGSRQLLRAYDGGADWLYALAVHQPTSRVAVGAFDGTVRLFSVDDDRPAAAFVAAPGLDRAN
jgi:sugar lactone lactonase YvrE